MDADSQSPLIVLGSRSPRRKELLQLLVPAEAIVVRPPKSHEELGFDDVHDWSGIENRVRTIVRDKLDDVLQQCRESPPDRDYFVLCADTVIVGQEADGELVVLGQPPNDETWRDVVRDWFRSYYLDKTHWALTGVCIVDPSARECRMEQVVRTSIRFGPADDAFLEWYLASGESIGKAGGYGLQGRATLFVDAFEGSPSNVIGLPLRETRELLLRLNPDFEFNRTSEQ